MIGKGEPGLNGTAVQAHLGWCTMDPLMGSPRERYGRLPTLAAIQHVQRVELSLWPSYRHSGGDEGWDA